MATIASVSRLSDRVPGSVSSSGCVFAVVGLLTGKLSINAIRRLLMSISSASRYQDFCECKKFRPVVQSVSMLSDGDAMQRISLTFVGRMCLHFSVPSKCRSPKLLPEKFVPVLPCCQTKGLESPLLTLSRLWAKHHKSARHSMDAIWWLNTPMRDGGRDASSPSHTSHCGGVIPCAISCVGSFQLL